MKQMSKVVDLTGQRFGRLVVLEIDDRGIKGKTYWMCQCDCGNVKSVRADSLRGGSIKSCGCMKREQDASNLSRETHGWSKTRLYAEWQGMRGRCLNKNNARYARYGGRGISVCKEWTDSFEAFRDWALANGYSDDLTIDRVDNDGDYSPGNCRWATVGQQSRNRCSNVDVTIGNSTRTLTEWCDIFGLNYGKVSARYKRNGDCTLDGLFNA